LGDSSGIIPGADNSVSVDIIGGGSGMGGPASCLEPRTCALGFGAMASNKELTFVLDYILDPYSRENSAHNLTDAAQSIYIIDYSGKDPMAISWEGGNKNLDNTKRPFIAPNSPNYLAAKNLESVSFYINPRNINIQQRKLWQKLRTRGGWALQHWGPDIGTIQIRGTTGNIRPPIGFNLSQLFSTAALDELPTVANSPAFSGLKKLEKWYKEDQDEYRIFRQELSALEYRGQLYVGHLTSFTYEESADEPFQLTYQIEFAIHYDASDLQMALNRATEHFLRNQETLDYMTKIYNDYNTVNPTH
jgi:hypothetical protein